MSTNQPTVCLDGIIFGLQRNGGIANYWARLIEAFSISTENRWKNVIPRQIQFQHYKAMRGLGNVTVETLPTTLSRYFSCPTESSDCVMHTSYYRLPSRPVKRYVVTVYDFMYERYRTGPALWVHSWQKKRSIEQADVVLCISSFTRNELIKFLPKIDPIKVQVIPLGVDTLAFYPDKNPKDSRLELTVLFVGQRGGYKRFELAIESVRSINRLNLGLIGPSLTKKETAILESRIPGRWHHLGSVSPVRLREIYSSAYALIFPSDCEGFGLPVLEAMACGCPVVASNRGSLPEIGGKAALLAEHQSPEAYASSLNSLQSSSTRVSTVASGFIQTQTFTWKKTFELTQEAYKY